MSFTKDELLIIHLDVNTEINKHAGILKPSPFHLALLEKIENMIEHYCEHDQLKIDMGTHYEVYPCKKCGEYYK